MTQRQSELLTYIRDYIFAHGYSPTLEEMKRKLNLVCVSTIRVHLKKLTKEGHLKRNAQRRGYELPVNTTDRISDLVHSTVFESLRKNGISEAAASEISRTVKEDVTRLLNEHTLNL